MGHGPLVFLVAMCLTRVSFLFKRYFCIDECWCCCCKGSGGQFKEQEFIEEECQELATIDMLKEKYEQSSDPMPETKRLTNGILNGNESQATFCLHQTPMRLSEGLEDFLNLIV